MRGVLSYHDTMREGGFRTVGGLAQRLAAGIAKGRGASIARLRAAWPGIVGAELARTTRPEALVAGRGGRAGAKVLRLRVSGAAALEVQHMSGQLVERVNAYAGHAMIEDIRLVQGAIGPTRPAPPPLAAPRRDVIQQIEGKVTEVRDPALRQALARLGTRIATGRRAVLLGALGMLFVADRADAQIPSIDKLLAELPSDHVLGRRDAPNIMIDYFSFTCPHCANFNAAVLPVLRRDLIDTGKMKLIMRHFPSDAVATQAALIAEGAGAARFYAAVDALFRTQVDWLTAAEPEPELAKALVGLGVTPEAARSFLADDRLLNKIVNDVQSGQALKVRATPSIFINEHFYAGAAGGAAEIAAILRQVGR